MSFYSLDGTEIYCAHDNARAVTRTIYNLDGERIDRGYLFYTPPYRGLLNATAATGRTKQGATTDGTYVYTTAGDSTTHTYMDIVKHNISTGAYTTKRWEDSRFWHANDMLYNPYNGYLYVATMKDNGAVLILNASNLNVVDTIYLTDDNGEAYTVWQFCFDRNTRRYYSAAPGDILYYIYDEDWNYIGKMPFDVRVKATNQTIETDGNYFYRLTWNPNVIEVLSMTGKTIVACEFAFTAEPESFMSDWNGNFYLTWNNTDNWLFNVKLIKD